MSIDWTKPVQTRDGSKVTIYTTTAPSDYPVHGYIEGWRSPSCWASCGHYHDDGECYDDGECEADLINVPEPKRVAWVNCYPDGAFGGYNTKAQADRCAVSRRIACVRVEWTPGQFDEEPQP